MLKDATYKEKCILLKSWMPQMIETVKKDLKNEHLKNDFRFVKKYFSGKNVNKLTTEDFVQGYSSALEQEEKAEELAEFMANRWLLKNTELYEYFETELSKISSNFTELTEIDAARSQSIVDGSVAQFGAPRTYVFSILNSVVFPKEILEKLDKRAKEEQKKVEHEAHQHQEQLNQETLKQRYEEQIARLTDKYEKKLIGLQKKYIQDTESLKKQVMALQKKLQG